LDWQHGFDVLLGIVATLGVWIVKAMHERLNKHDEQLDELPGIYARRDDVKEMKQEMLAVLVRIENKLDNKADKHG
jgi:hypothetical protein